MVLTYRPAGQWKPIPEEEPKTFNERTSRAGPMILISRFELLDYICILSFVNAGICTQSLCFTCLIATRNYKLLTTESNVG